MSGAPETELFLLRRVLFFDLLIRRIILEAPCCVPCSGLGAGDSLAIRSVCVPVAVGGGR